MKKSVVAMVAVSMLVCGARGAIAEDTDAIPSGVREDAKHTFAQGKTCHIWRDTNTTVRVEAFPFGGNLIIVGPFRVLASPKAAGPVAFEPAWQLVAQDKTSGTPDIQTASVKGPTALQATATNVVTFGLLVAGQSSESISAALSGKGPISVFIVEPTEKKGTIGPQLSNALRLVVDIDNKKITD